jgi:hypothetical protein
MICDIEITFVLNYYYYYYYYYSVETYIQSVIFIFHMYHIRTYIIIKVYSS